MSKNTEGHSQPSRPKGPSGAGTRDSHRKLLPLYFTTTSGLGVKHFLG
jgi:hypothetical protein